MQGYQVVVVQRTIERDNWNLYIVHPSPDILIGATDAALLDELVVRMNQRATFELPPVLHNWSRIDSRALFWASRSEFSSQSNEPESGLAFVFSRMKQANSLRMFARAVGIPNEAEARAALVRDFVSFGAQERGGLSCGETESVVSEVDISASSVASLKLLALMGHIVQL